MVGKPTSKGCRRCRSKKKGCDQAKPRCGQCQRLGVSCEYDQRQFFVTSSSSSAEPMTRSEAGPSEQDAALPLIASSSNSPLVDRSLARTELEIRIDSDFWSNYLPEAPHTTAALLSFNSSARTLAPVLRYVATQDNTVRLALNAVSFMTLGRLRQDQDYIRRGTQLYSTALRQTNQILANPQHSRSDGALASTQLLALFEHLRGNTGPQPLSQSMDWRRHVEGTCHLLRLRGPEVYATPVGRKLYLDIRVSSVLCGIFSKKSLSPAGMEWTSLPWQDGDQRDLGDELYDIMSDIPSLLARQDVAYEALIAPCDDVSGAMDAATQTLDDCLVVASKLIAWEKSALALCHLRDELVAQDEDPEQNESTPAPALNSLADIGANYGYDMLDLASQFWFASVFLLGRTLVMHGFLRQAASIYTTPGTTSAAAETLLPDLPASIDPEPYAAAIARNGCHFQDPAAGVWGAQRATICLAAGTHYYAAVQRQFSLEMQQLRGAILTVKGKLFSMGFLRSIAHIASPSFVAADGTFVDAASFEGREILARKWFRMDDVPYVAGRSPSSV